MDLEFHRGDDAQMREMETVVPLGERYTNEKLILIMVFCGI